MFKKNLQLKVCGNTRLKATQITGQKKAFYRDRIPETQGCSGKETLVIDILVASRNGGRKIMNRSSRPKVFCKKVALRNFTKFTGKHLCYSIFFNKVAGLSPEACNFIKKETLPQVFSCEF